VGATVLGTLLGTVVNKVASAYLIRMADGGTSLTSMGRILRDQPELVADSRALLDTSIAGLVDGRPWIDGI
jgi:hypothetical protein